MTEGSQMSRIDKENYYLDIAQTVLERSTCLCSQYGALIVRNDEIVYVPISRAVKWDKPIARELIDVLSVLSI